MIEFDVSGKTYRTGKMNAFKQFALMKRILPIVGAMGDFGGMAIAMKAGEGGAALAQFAGPLIDAISRMPDADSDFVLTECMAVCSRRDGENWQAIWNHAAGQPQFADIELAAMLQIAWNVIQDNMAVFMAGLPLAFTEPTPGA